jgi:predicted N-acetyltransferase YhbS
MMQIRRATFDDRERIHDLYLAAFPAAEGEPVAELTVALLLETTTPETLALVAEANEQLTGHIAFSPSRSAGRIKPEAISWRRSLFIRRFKSEGSVQV